MESVRSVTPERWRAAQRWERELWEQAQRKHGWKRIVWPIAGPMLRAVGWRRAWGDDWNHWWKLRFEEYAFLPSHLGEMIELGCGPYTNTRLILEGRTANRVVCSDPLVRTYVTFEDRWLARAHRDGRVEIDDHPIEETPFAPGSFDLVVMINVLDHVRDSDLCLRNAVWLVREGGVFVLGQDLSDAGDLARHPYDVGHPIRLNHDDLEPYLAPLATILRKNLSRDEGRDPRLHYSTLLFAGRKEADG